MSDTSSSTALPFDAGLYVHEYMQDLARIQEDMRETLVKQLPIMADMLDGVRERGGTIFTMGNGGSGAAASHLAGDLNKYTITTGEARFSAISLIDNAAYLLAVANDQSYDEVFVEQLMNHAKPGDALIGISGSGNSENCVRAIQWCKANDVQTVTWTGYGGGRMAELADLPIQIPSYSMVRCEDMHVIIHHCLASMLKAQLDARQGKAHVSAAETIRRVG